MKSVHTRKIKPPSKCLCINTRRACRAITEFYDQTLASSGLKITQYSLLRNIQRIGPLNITELAEEVRLDRTTLARNLKSLEVRGLVKLVPGEDLRTRRVQITKKGREAVKTAFPLWEKAQSMLMEHFGAEEMSILTTLLLKLESITD